MKWIKKGLIYHPKNNFGWDYKYAMMPTPIIHNGNIRVFFGTTDSEIYGRPTYIDLNIQNPSEILYKNNKVLVDLGKDGTFDDSGVIPSSFIRKDNEYFLYYVGFQRSFKVPYLLFSGILKTNDLINFNRISESPFYDRNKENIYSNAAPFVIFDKEEGLYKMWFWQGVEWVTVNNKKYIKAEIHYTTSKNGIDFDKKTHKCIIPSKENNEFSVGRPWVIKKNKSYIMYYYIRYIDKLYRIGHARSSDGINWIRDDENTGIDVSNEGWDSEMICYPAVIDVGDKTYMFYNGNNNGETGFGYAELIND